MAIVAGNLKFLASERMIDNLSSSAGIGGGGGMSTTLVIDGVENNVFPDVMPGDRLSGAMQLREVYPIVLSADNDTLFNATSGLSARASDANIEIVAFTIPTGNLSSQAAAAVGTRWTVSTPAQNGQITGGSNVVDLFLGEMVPAVGDLCRLYIWDGATPVDRGMRVVTAVAGDLVTFDGSGSPVSGSQGASIRRVVGAGAGTRVSAVSLTTAGASAADTAVTLDKLLASVQIAGTSSLDTTGEPVGRSGTLPLYLPGDQLLFEHGTVPTTREAAVVASVNHVSGVVTLTAGLVNAYPTGSKVTRPVALGALKAAANNAFTQQTWTRAFSDSPIGSSVSARYGGSIGMTNEGGVTDRWAIVFTSATAFNLVSERLGQIASGTTASNFLPLNPLTSQPYFTLYSSGWGSGWLPGNTFRFNTVGASAPLWLSRLTKPSSPGGTTQATLFMRGDVNA